MKHSLLIIKLLLTSIVQAQKLQGAWRNIQTSDNGQKIKNILIFSEQYQVLTSYDATSGAFISTNGGSWSLDGSTMTEVVEFNSNNLEKVGKTVTFDIILQDDQLNIKGSDHFFTRIDTGNPGVLNGAWLMSGRIRNGETQERDTSKPRKTMKILSGTRFQWIAYNTETKEFKGTGGGTYTTVNGKYTENTTFFSRDNTRVGASLEFNYELKDGNWHHSGKSNKGDPIYEIWSTRQ